MLEERSSSYSAGCITLECWCQMYSIECWKRFKLSWPTLYTQETIFVSKRRIFCRCHVYLYLDHKHGSSVSWLLCKDIVMPLRALYSLGFRLASSWLFWLLFVRFCLVCIDVQVVYLDFFIQIVRGVSRGLCASLRIVRKVLISLIYFDNCLSSWVISFVVSHISGIGLSLILQNYL